MSIKVIKIRKGQKELPIKELDSLADYTGLELIGGSMEELPDLTKQIQHMDTLIISCPELRTFPKFIYKLQELEILKVKNAKLDLIENEPISFKKLKKIDFNSNKLTELPKWIYSLERLEELSASGNLIIEISEEISNLKLLKRINLDRNSLKKIPKALLKNKNLNHLSLEQNNFPEEVKNELFLNFKIWFN